ncbi:lysozyme [Halenospora varia]|nr:lysozyme [Halenospora varia]
MINLTPTLLAILLSLTTHALAAPGTTTCEITSGQKGLCVATASCKSSGGKSEAGHCPGGIDNQCCTYGTCTVNSIAGLCQPTSSCTGTSTAGHCPGAADIQCCTSKYLTTTTPTTNCGAPDVNQATLELVEGFEGWYANAYKDPDGNPTIGYGHLCRSASCSEIAYHIPLSKSDGDKLLQSDLAIARKCISSQISDSVKLNANQYGALVSWAFNVGCGNSGSSTLIKRLDKGEAPNTVAGEELPKWNRGSNGVLPGLTRRRATEVVLFKTANSEVGHPPAC